MNNQNVYKNYIFVSPEKIILNSYKVGENQMQGMINLGFNNVKGS